MGSFSVGRRLRRDILPLLSALAALLVDRAPASAAAAVKCAAAGPEFFCPACIGIVSDCWHCGKYLFADRNAGLCYGRKLFHGAYAHGDSDHSPFLWFDLTGTVLWFLTAGVATACGVGGGGIYVPMGLLLLRLPPKPSAGLSQASIFGAALGGLLVNIHNRHPNDHIRDTRGAPSAAQEGKIIAHELDKGPAEIAAERRRYLAGGDGARRFYTRPLIDYDMALFLAPMEMAGAVLGVVIQGLLPDWLFLSFAVVILGFISINTFQRFRIINAKETLARQNVMRLAASEISEGYVEMAVIATDNDALAEQDGAKELAQRRQFLEEDARQYPEEKVAGLVTLWVGLAVITYLKGGKGTKSAIGVTCQDAGYYALIAAQFLWTLGFAGVFGVRNVRATRARLAVHYPFNETDVLWDPAKLRCYSFSAFAAGIVAGLVGVGGGMVLGPLMLAMGVDPSVSAATTATMILLTSSTVAVMSVLSGLIPWGFALYFFSICLGGAYFGKTRIDSYVKDTGMASILVGALAAITGVSTVGCIFILFENLAEASWCLDGFKQFCTIEMEGEEACMIS